jgi:hypothetical protein
VSPSELLMDKHFQQCVIPGPTEEVLAVLPGERPGTALRVRVEAGRDGYVRLEQLAHNADLGWYVQKSFCIPGEMLAALIPQLRKADCLIPRPRAGAAGHVTGDPIPMFPAPVSSAPRGAERREA